MIAALVRAAAVFERPDWLERAQKAFGFVTGSMMTDDRLAHSWRAGERLDLAFLEDYANMSAAALALFEHTADARYLEQAVRWVDRLDVDYLDAGQGGYFQISADASDVLVRVKNAQDGPTPAGNGIMLEVLARLHLLTGDDRYRVRGDELLAAFSGEAARNAAVHAALLASTLWLDQPVQIVVIGKLGAPDTDALRQAALELPQAAATLLTVTAGERLPSGHPAAGKSAAAGRATAYVCRGQTCGLPITDPDQLVAALAPQHPPAR
jgi:uncharacterized protein YyaL (SSP411 family)